MKGFIIDPGKKSIEEIELAKTEKQRLAKIAEILGSSGYHITFIYPEEHRTCTGYVTAPDNGAPYFRVKGFVNKVIFGKTVVADKTASGFPKSDGVNLEELGPMITFCKPFAPARAISLLVLVS